MSDSRYTRRAFVGALVSTGFAGVATTVLADPPPAGKLLKEPVFRVSAANISGEQRLEGHPLDPALNMAHDSLKHIQANIVDYTCLLVKRERINGKVNEYEYMDTKIRNRKVQNGTIVTPLSVYMKFRKPDTIKGREVLYIENENNGKLIAKEGGTKGIFLPAVWLNPDGPIAMRGNLYPITDVGVENLVAKLIERGMRDRQMGPCDVAFNKGAKINGRRCTVLQVMHSERKPHYDFYRAEIFIDDELNVPIRYAAYDWPTAPGDTRGEVIEEYTYLNLKLNVGLQDHEFDYNNPGYSFVRR